MSERLLMLAVISRAKKDLKNAYTRICRRGLVLLAINGGRRVPYKEAKTLLRDMEEHHELRNWFAGCPELADEADVRKFFRFPWNGRLARGTVAIYVKENRP